jgi:hypothetical protein
MLQWGACDQSSRGSSGASMPESMAWSKSTWSAWQEGETRVSKVRMRTSAGRCDRCVERKGGVLYPLPLPFPLSACAAQHVSRDGCIHTVGTQARGSVTLLHRGSRVMHKSHKRSMNTSSAQARARVCACVCVCVCACVCLFDLLVAHQLLEHVLEHLRRVGKRAVSRRGEDIHTQAQTHSVLARARRSCSMTGGMAGVWCYHLCADGGVVRLHGHALHHSHHLQQGHRVSKVSRVIHASL